MNTESTRAAEAALTEAVIAFHTIATTALEAELSRVEHAIASLKEQLHHNSAAAIDMDDSARVFIESTKAAADLLEQVQHFNLHGRVA